MLLPSIIILPALVSRSIVRGNNEDGQNQTVMPLLNAYLATAVADMPVNGLPGEEKLTYSSTYRGAKFIGTDDYIASPKKKAGAVTHPRGMWR
jgi:hypothetical protein